MNLGLIEKSKVQIEDLIMNKVDLKTIIRIILTIINRRRIPLPSALYRYYTKPPTDEIDDMGNENFLSEYIIPELGKCLVDVGASIGGWTFFVAKKGREVYAFEPSPKAYEILKMRAKKHPAVHAYPYALGDKDDVGRIGLSAFGLGGTMDVEIDGLPGGGTIDITLRKLDSLCLPNVGVIKIDTEGYEVPILQGAKQTIQKYQPCLIIEVHKDTGQAAKTFSEELQRIKNMLKDLNYTWGIHYRAVSLRDQQPHLIANPKN